MKSLSFSIIAKLGVIILILTATVMLVAHGFKNPSSASGKLQVVAGENVWGNIISQIGGDKVQVTSIINDPGADPHLYESNAHDALAISRAKLVVANGLGYDNFLDKLLSAAPNTQRRELRVANVLHISDTNANPHLWYDIPKVPIIAQAFEAAMAQKDPADKALFAANLKKFNQSLQPLLVKIQEVKTQFAGTPVAYTERVPEYLLSDAGLDVRTPEGFATSVEDGNEPSPADQSAMQKLLASKQVRVLLYNSQATSPITEHVRAQAQLAAIPIVGVTETTPKHYQTYQAWQEAQLDALLAALKTN